MTELMKLSSNWDWRLGLEIGIGDWDWEMGLGNGIGKWEMRIESSPVPGDDSINHRPPPPQLTHPITSNHEGVKLTGAGGH